MENLNKQEFTPARKHPEQPGLADYDFMLSFGRYAEVVANAQKANQLVEQIDEFIDYVNSGQLPEGHMIFSRPNLDTPLWSVQNGTFKERLTREKGLPEHADYVYRPDENGEYIFAGEIATGSGSQVFLGDRFLKIDGTVIVVNTDLQVGMVAGEEIDVIDLQNDPTEHTMRGSYQKRFEDFKKLLDEVRDGAQIYSDQGYY